MDVCFLILYNVAIVAVFENGETEYMIFLLVPMEVILK
jgi:hypothetical protein